MKNLKHIRPVIHLRVIYITLLFSIFSCTPTLPLRVTIYDSIYDQIDNKISVYLLDAKGIESLMKVHSFEISYLDSISRSIDWSINQLQSEYERKRGERFALFDQLIRKSATLSTKYIQKINPRIIDISRFENSWQVTMKFLNNGQEKIHGINVSLAFNDHNLIKNLDIQLDLNSGSVQIFDELYFDLSDNLPMHLKMASYPGGLRELVKQMDCQIHSVVSDFDVSLRPLLDKIESLDNEINEIGMQIDLARIDQYNELTERVIRPGNIILEKNLQDIAIKVEKLSRSDTAVFQELKQRNMSVIAYSTPYDSIQWFLGGIIPEKDKTVVLSPSNHRHFFLILNSKMKNEDIFLERQ